MRAELPKLLSRAIFMIERWLMADYEHERVAGHPDPGITATETSRRGTRATGLRVLFGFAAVVGVVVLAGCASQTRAQAIYVPIPPPRDPVEVEGGAPSPVYVWVKGHYDWNGVEYVWIPGAWEQKPGVGARWIAGQWRRTRRGWTWVDGHWS